MEKIYLTLPEVAVLLQCSHATIYRYTSQRKIPFIKMGNRVLFKREDIEDWMDEHRVEPMS